jgi:methionyl-tRNA synthetase
MPEKMKQLREQLGISSKTTWDQINDHLVSEGHFVAEQEILFNKIEDEIVEKEIQKLNDKSEAQSGKESKFPALKKTTTFDDFMSLDLRAGKIVAAEKVKKSNKLIQIKVDLGFEKRTILSGIAEFFSPDNIVGKSVCVVANLAPKKMMGIESNGMILMGEDSEGSLHFVETDAEPGSPIT